MSAPERQRAGYFLTPPRWMIPHISRVHTQLYRRTNGRIGASAARMRHILLTTVGRRSGNLHTVCLPYWRDHDGERILVASYSGAPRSPAWFHNLADRSANPTVAVQEKARRFEARADVLAGGDRDEIWTALTTDRPFFAHYQARTERRIPLVRLVEQRPTPSPEDVSRGLMTRECRPCRPC